MKTRNPNPLYSYCSICGDKILYSASFSHWFHDGPTHNHQASPSYVHPDLNVSLDAKNCESCGKSVCPTLWSDPCPFCGKELRRTTQEPTATPSRLEFMNDLDYLEFERD